MLRWHSKIALGHVNLPVERSDRLQLSTDDVIMLLAFDHVSVALSCTACTLSAGILMLELLSVPNNIRTDYGFMCASVPSSVPLQATLYAPLVRLERVLLVRSVQLHVLRRYFVKAGGVRPRHSPERGSPGELLGIYRRNRTRRGEVSRSDTS